MKRRLFCVLLLAATGCSTLQPVVQPVSFVAEKHPKYVLVTTTEPADGEDPILFEQPRILNDQLVGYVFGDETKLPVSRIRVMQASQRDRRKTTFAIIGGAAVLGTLGFIIANQGKTIDKDACAPPTCGNFPH